MKTENKTGKEGIRRVMCRAKESGFERWGNGVISPPSRVNFLNFPSSGRVEKEQLNCFSKIGKLGLSIVCRE